MKRKQKLQRKHGRNDPRKKQKLETDKILDNFVGIGIRQLGQPLYSFNLINPNVTQIQILF